MATIGTFKKTSATDYTGEIATLTLQARNVRIVAEKGSSANAPTHRVFVGKADYAE